MANIKSQIKRNRQNERRRLRNRAVRTRLRTEARKVQTAVEAGDLDAAAAQLRTTAQLFDKAAAKGVIHRNTAARRKSGLAREVARAPSE